MSDLIMDNCPSYAPFLGAMGAAASIIFANCGAAYGTAKAGVGIMQSGIKSPELIWRNLIPVVMAGVNGIYGLITAIILISNFIQPDLNGNNRYSAYTGWAHLAAGLTCGLSGLGSGMCIGIAGDAAVHACGIWDYSSKMVRLGKGFHSNRRLGGGGADRKKAGGGDKIFVCMVLIQVFAGNIALYGLIASILLSQQTYYCGDAAN